MLTARPPPSSPRHLPLHIVRSPDATFGLLLGVFVACGLALLGLLAFVSWKLCLTSRQPAKARHPSLGQERRPLQPLPAPPPSPPVAMATEKVKDPAGSMGFLEAAVKISHTSPDIPTDVQLSMREHFLRRTQRMQRQTTEPASSTRSVLGAVGGWGGVGGLLSAKLIREIMFAFEAAGRDNYVGRPPYED